MVRVSLILPAALATIFACRPTIPGPPIGPHEEAPIEVPYPPPAARPEQLPPAPSETAVWVDGSYTWSGDGYEWTDGGWQEPEPASHWAPPTLVRRRNGELLYYKGHWHLDSSAAER